jgi:hypothetical protein
MKTLMERLIERLSDNIKPNLYREREKGHEAYSLLNDPIFSDVIQSLRNRLINEWEASPIRDIDGQHKLKLMLNALDGIVRNLEEAYQTGKLAAKQLEDEEEKKRQRRKK